jgi:hypothetical protein
MLSQQAGCWVHTWRATQLAWHAAAVAAAVAARAFKPGAAATAAHPLQADPAGAAPQSSASAVWGQLMQNSSSCTAHVGQLLVKNPWDFVASTIWHQQQQQQQQSSTMLRRMLRLQQ